MSNRGAATLYDVARAAGVSTATVSRVVHGQDRVRSATRQRVLQVIEALGYVPDAAAQSMARQRKEVIGLAAIESRGPEIDIEHEGLLFVDEVLRGVELALRHVEWSVLISVLREADRPGAFQQLQKISAKVDGMLISEGVVSSQELARLAARIPITLVAGSLDEPHADVVGVDNWAGTMALARHIIERHGRTRLFYISGPPEAKWHDDFEGVLNQASMRALRAQIRSGSRPECSRCVCSLWRDPDHRGVSDFLPAERLDA